MLKHSSRRPYSAQYCIISASLAFVLHIAGISYKGKFIAFDVRTCSPKLATTALRKYFYLELFIQPRSFVPSLQTQHGKTKWHSQAGPAVTYNHTATPEGGCCKLEDLFPKCKLSPFTCIIAHDAKQAFWKWFHRLYD